MFKTSYFTRVAVAFILCIFVSGCAPVQQQSFAPRKVQAIEYRLGTGDTIRLTVFGHEELSGDFTVGPAGRVSFPLVLDTTVSGLTVEELEDVLAKKLSPQYLLDPKVSIDVLHYRDVYILGEVRVPGKYPYIPNMTLQKAVAIAGGYTYRAKENSAELTRQTGDVIKTNIIDGKSMILPGDTLVITRKWF